MERSTNKDDYVVRLPGQRSIGLLGTKTTSIAMGWLASHRGRLSSFLIGGKRWSLILIRDNRPGEMVERSQADFDAIEQLTYGKTTRIDDP